MVRVKAHDGRDSYRRRLSAAYDRIYGTWEAGNAGFMSRCRDGVCRDTARRRAPGVGAGRACVEAGGTCIYSGDKRRHGTWETVDNTAEGRLPVRKDKLHNQ